MSNADKERVEQRGKKEKIPTRNNAPRRAACTHHGTVYNTRLQDNIHNSQFRFEHRKSEIRVEMYIDLTVFNWRVPIIHHHYFANNDDDDYENSAS